VIFIASCNPQKNEILQPNLDKLISAVSNKTIQQLRNEKELCACGFGSGGQDQIRMLALAFNYYKEIDIKEARELLIFAGSTFLKTINSNENIRSFLKNDPFTLDNIEIRIFFRKQNGRDPDLGKLTVISMIKGILEYDIRSPETERLITICEETFEEAEAKLFHTANQQVI